MKNKIEKMSKNTKIGIGAVIIVVIAAFLARGAMNKKAAPVEVVPEPVVEMPVVKPVAKKTSSTKVTTPAPAVDTRGYAELMIAYKNRTLQFGAACQVVTSMQAYKLGSEMLLDNRNSTPVAVKIGSMTYNLAGYGHQVITLGTEGTFVVDCNEYRNVATISVQK
jgi:hypothetical protein